MAVLSCPLCEENKPRWSDLGEHLWQQHRPFDKENHSCPGCEYPIKEDNIIYHLPCFSTTEPETVWTYLTPDSGICPICGGIETSEEEARDHIEQHSATEQKQFLGKDPTCRICGGSPGSSTSIEGHLTCFGKHFSVGSTKSGKKDCPYCESEFEHRGAVRWHIWENHFEAEGFTTTCLFCGESFSYGYLNEHLLCFEGEIHGPAVSQLLSVTIPECFVCGTSFLNPSVTERHIGSKHLRLIERLDSCTVCGDSIQYAEAHYPCLAMKTGNELPIDRETNWMCPNCGHKNKTLDNLFSHIESSHELDLFETGDCRVCSKPLGNLSDHTSCLLTLFGYEESKQCKLDIELPSATVVRPKRATFNADDPLDDSSVYDLFQDMQRFIHREKRSEVEETWNNYSNVPLWRLKRNENVLDNLYPWGKDTHLDSDFQFEFRHAPSEGTNDLWHRTYIREDDEVIIGNKEGDTGFPMKAQVEHITDDRIYISPKPEQNYHNSELEHLFSDSDGPFHIVQLLNTIPYDRKKRAIDAAKRDEEAMAIVSGEKILKEYPRSVQGIYTQNLNDDQKEAVGRALGTNDICCIQGPPGTGKTRTLTAIIKLAIARGDNVLACAHSNPATDNLLIGDSSKDAVDEGSLYAFEQEISEVTISRAGSNTDSEIVAENYAHRDPDEADLVVATTSAVDTLDIDSFDLVVVDEATQADQPSTLIPFLQGERVVLAGDQQQLPPYCSSETSKEEEIHISLFEHLLNVYGDKIATKLSKQYRMHEEIAAFPNEQFYEGDLEHGEENRTWQVSDLDPVVGYDISNPEQTKSETHSKYNPGEAEIIAFEVALLIDKGVSPSEIGVITAYSAQIEELKNANIEKKDQIDIDTIDSFQGSERQVILISFVRSHQENRSGFLTKPDEGERRLNVALTRAKKRIVLVGDFETLGTVADHLNPADSCAEVYQDLRDHLKLTNNLKTEYR